MKVPIHLTLGVLAAALLSGCGGAVPQAGLTPPGASPLGASGTSWMAPGAQSQDLLYIGNIQTVTVYSYPGGKLMGTLRGFSQVAGECVDKAGDVFMANANTGKIFEYPHGSAKRIATLESPSPGPTGCAIDPTTGNLAVSSLGGGVGVFKHARGKPQKYRNSHVYSFFWCGYDDKGNLFVDGLSQPSGNNFVFAELPKGGKALRMITLRQNIGFPGGVQWDGRYVAVGDQDTSVIYRFTIDGDRGTKEGLTKLGGPVYDVHQFFILSGTLIAPNIQFSTGDALFYPYPAGGVPTKKITKGIHVPQGAVVSPAST